MDHPVKNIHTILLSDKTYTLSEYKYAYKHSDTDPWETQEREIYDRGNGAAVLLYNTVKKTVILTQQFRLPIYLNSDGRGTGMSIEACAGLLDTDDPETCVKREALEETGYQIPVVQKVLETITSPGVMTEVVHLFIGAYTDAMKIEKGGGLAEEQEHIEVLEVPFQEALTMVSTGRIQDAKTMLLVQYMALHKVMG